MRLHLAILAFSLLGESVIAAASVAPPPLKTMNEAREVVSLFVSREFYLKRPPSIGETIACLECKVQDMAGKAVSGATVMVKRTDINLAHPRRTASNSSGYFLLAGLVLGTYEIAIEAEGFEPVIDRITVKTGGFYVVYHLPRLSESVGASMRAFASNQSFRKALEFTDAQRFLEALPLLEESLASMKATLETLGSDSSGAAAREYFHYIEHVYAKALFEAGKGSESRKAELWGRAKPLFEAALERQAEDPVALTSLLGIAEYQRDSAAAATYKMAIERAGSPEPIQAYNDALSAYKGGRYSEAKAALLEAIAKSPRFSESYYLLGLNEGRLGNRTEAREAFTQYLAMAPTGAHVNRALEFLKILSQDTVPKRLSKMKKTPSS